jgi:hypothetical protein
MDFGKAFQKKKKEEDLDKTIEMFEIDPAMIEVDIHDDGKTPGKKGMTKQLRNLRARRETVSSRRMKKRSLLPSRTS